MAQASLRCASSFKGNTPRIVAVSCSELLQCVAACCRCVSLSSAPALTFEGMVVDVGAACVGAGVEVGARVRVAVGVGVLDVGAEEIGFTTHCSALHTVPCVCACVHVRMFWQLGREHSSELCCASISAWGFTYE